MESASRQRGAWVISLLATCLLSFESGCAWFPGAEQRAALKSFERARERESAIRQASFNQEVDGPADDSRATLKDGLQLDDLSPDKLGNSLKQAAGLGPDREKAQQSFDRAEALFNEAEAAYAQDATAARTRRAFLDAAKAYTGAGGNWPESSIEQDSLFKAGESYFFADHYVEANEAFEELISKYPGTRYLDMAQARRFAIAKYWLELAREDPDNMLTVNLTDDRRPMRDIRGHALRVLDRMRLDDPTGKLADDATMALANAYFEAERYLDAADTYEDLRIAFPTSQHQYDAHVLELKARLEAYQGSAYDGTHLEKADKLLKSVMQQFPTEIGEERGELEKVASEVRFRLAEREMKMARFYDYSGQYRSATIYYQQVLEQYPNSPQAEEARERIAAIADKPAKPPQRAQWLIDLFPESEATRPLIPSSPTKAALK